MPPDPKSPRNAGFVTFTGNPHGNNADFILSRKSSRAPMPTTARYVSNLPSYNALPYGGPFQLRKRTQSLKSTHPPRGGGIKRLS